MRDQATAPQRVDDRASPGGAPAFADGGLDRALWRNGLARSLAGTIRLTWPQRSGARDGSHGLPMLVDGRLRR